jgi:hypothetical protein
LAAAGQSQPHDGGRVPSRCPLHQPLCCSPHLPPHRSAVPSPTWPAALDDKQGQPLMRSQTARLVRKGSPLHTARRYVAQHRTTKGGTVLLRVTQFQLSFSPALTNTALINQQCNAAVEPLASRVGQDTRDASGQARCQRSASPHAGTRCLSTNPRFTRPSLLEQC